MKTLLCCARAVVLLVVVLSVFGCNRNRDLVELKELSQMADRANNQYRNGDYATAKAALTEFVRELERRLTNPETLNVEAIKSDIAITYVRLAKLEEKNDGPEKDAFMSKAVDMCQKQTIKRSCSDHELRAQVDFADALPLK